MRQSWHALQGTITSSATRPPGCTPQRCAARSPTSSTIPRGSCPGITGPPARTGRCPRYISTSLPQMPLASTRSRPSSGPMRGRGNSRSSIWRGATCTAARTVSPMGCSCPNLVGGGYTVPDGDGGPRPPGEEPHDHRDAGVAGTGDGDEQVGPLARGEQRVEAVGTRPARVPYPVVAEPVLADEGEVADGAPAVLGEPGAHLGATESGGGEHLRVLGAEHDAHRGVPEDPRPGAGDRGGEVGEQPL